jgi:hypothetical protein
MALGDTVGRVSFCRIPDAPEMSGFRKRITGTMDETTAELIEVQVETLDRQCADLDSVEYIKIDVEGAEIDCLRGGRKTIARHRPFISVEYGRPTYLSYGHTKMTLFVLVNEIGYVISDLFGNLIRSSDAWMRICDAAYWDYMLVPVERLDYWNELFDDLT